MSMLDRYKEIFKGNLAKDDKKPTAYLPKITDDDYKLGYIRRYFTQRTQDINSAIIEVSSNTYLKFIANPNYRTTQLRWRISGTKNEVTQSNKIAIQIASEKMKNLKLYLPNLLQFHK